MKYSFSIPLKPKAKDRPRHRGNVSYTPKATRDYEEQVRYYYDRDVGNPPTDKPVMLTLCFNFAQPKGGSVRNKRTVIGTCPYSSRPDLDNVEKAIQDALNGVAFKDDSQIVAKVSLKRYWFDSSITIIIEEMEEIDYGKAVFAEFPTDRRCDGSDSGVAE